MSRPQDFSRYPSIPLHFLGKTQSRHTDIGEIEVAGMMGRGGMELGGEEVGWALGWGRAGM